MMDFKEIMERVNTFHICIRCTGRLFAQIGHELDNVKRGESIAFVAKTLGMKLNLVPEVECSICRGIFSEIDKYASEIERMTKNFEFNSMLVGSTFSQETLALEKNYQDLCGSNGEPIKKEFSRELGKVVLERMGKEFDRVNPEIMIKVNTEFMSIDLQVKSLCIYGTYRKYIRGIPQTRWIKYSEETRTVESLIGSPIMSMSKGRDYVLHGAGREDVDVRMLGNGREFVIEVHDPVVRTLDLHKVEEFINNQKNGVEVSNLRFSSKEEIAKIKSDRHAKIYNAKISLRGEDNFAQVWEATKELIGKVIYQRTPLRVSISRSDLIRERKIIDIKPQIESDGSIILTIEAEAGTYIKELISGDEGRTRPSLSELLSKEVRIEELDVIEILR